MIRITIHVVDTVDKYVSMDKHWVVSSPLNQCPFMLNKQCMCAELGNRQETNFNGFISLSYNFIRLLLQLLTCPAAAAGSQEKRHNSYIRFKLNPWMKRVLSMWTVFPTPAKVLSSGTITCPSMSLILVSQFLFISGGMMFHTQLPSQGQSAAFFSVHVSSHPRDTFIKMILFYFSWLNLDDGLRNRTHSKMRLIFWVHWSTSSCPKCQITKMVGTLKSWWISLFHLFESWSREGDFHSVKTVSWEIFEALWESALTACGH